MASHDMNGTGDSTFEHQYQKGTKEARVFNPKNSTWWNILQHPDLEREETRMARRFRQKFRSGTMRPPTHAVSKRQPFRGQYFFLLKIPKRTSTCRCDESVRRHY